MADSNIIKYVNNALIAILKSNLPTPLPYTVQAGPPDRAASVTKSTLFLYLYQVLESPTLKNSGPRVVAAAPPPAGSAQSVQVLRDPLALDLYFLVIPATKKGDDTAFLDAYMMLGNASIALHDNGVFTLGQWGITDASAKDVKLQVTMNPLTTTQLFELWEAVNEPYRLSVSYVVRTVRIESTLTTDTPLVSQRNFQTTQI